MVASAQTPAAVAPAPAPAAGWRWEASTTSRVESWSFFDPPATGGNPDYVFVANRLRVGVTGTWPRVDVNVTGQYVQCGGLPTDAIGPGPLGTGALYFDHGGRASSRGMYVRTAFLRLKPRAGAAIQAGRFPYRSGGESASGRAKVEVVKRARIDSRLIGEFEWSLFQRSFDGVRVDVDRARWHATSGWFVPTQGGFENAAGASLRHVNVAVATVTWRPSVVVPATDLQIFATRYNDERPVTARPDNSGLAAGRADVHVSTVGVTAVGSASTPAGEADWLIWGAGQTGDWYGTRHRAWSLAVEGGHQWTVRTRPWIRGGLLQASGDSDARDNRHGTFFPMLPTARKYAFTTAYTPMNLRDAFLELSVRPSPRVTARADIRRLWLASRADLWYSGSGASQARGAAFGFAGRRSGGSTDLGAVVEGAAEVTVNRRWSVNGFFGTIHAGRVVHAVFPGDWLQFAYLENLVQF